MQYKPTMMTYDLRRFVRKGIIHRIPDTNRYILTTYGLKVCRFFARLDARVFRPTFGAITSTESSSYPKPLRKAMDRVDREIDKLIDEATFLSRPKAGHNNNEFLILSPTAGSSTSIQHLVLTVWNYVFLENLT